jgi:hypothetical protein
MWGDQVPNRATEVAAERRRRDDANLGPKLKLAIPDEVRDRLAAEGRTPRWVNDSGSRIADLTQRDDYDKVEGVEPVKVDVDDEGKPVFAHLLSKRNDFIAEDRAKVDQRRRQAEAGMLKGKSPTGQPLEGQMGATTFVDPASKIGRANQVLE